MRNNNRRSVDVAAQQMLACACDTEVRIAWDRLESQQPQCGFGELGICCRNCTMGPCRIDPFGNNADAGVCGATADTIVARNLLRSLLDGGAAHSDHGREIVHALELAAEGKSDAYRIKGRVKLHKLAEEYGVANDGRSDEKVAKELADLLLGEFGKQKGTLLNINRAPEQQRKNWAAAGVTPRGVDREVVTGMHMTHIGVDNEPEHLLMGAVRAALAGQGDHPGCPGETCCRLYDRGRFRDSGRPVLPQLSASERRHPGRPFARRGGRRGLQQSQVSPRRVSPDDGQGTDP